MLLIRNAKLYTMDDLGLLDGGDVLINGDKIAFVGMNLSAPGARVIDARGAYVTPGLVDAHSHIGMWEDGQREETGDGNEETDVSRRCARSTRSTRSTAAFRTPSARA